MPDRDYWFAYRVRGQRLTAWPVSLAGWLVLAGLIGFPLVALNLAMPVLVERFGRGAILVGLLAVFAVTFPTLIWLVRARGRRET